MIPAAFDDPQGWVLKPSREGGGNNIWEDDMLKKLTELKGCKEREAFILMQRLKPPHVPNRLLSVYNYSHFQFIIILTDHPEFTGLFMIIVMRTTAAIKYL